MKHVITAYNTKKMLADALRELMREKDISKITISELTQKTGLNRKTFYYHFRDVYDLLAWMFENEAIAVVAHFDLVTDYKKAISFVMDYLEQNEYLVSSVAGSPVSGEVRRFLYQDLFAVSVSTISKIEDAKGIQLEHEYKNFIAEFYTEAISGMIVRWATDPKVRNRAKIETYLSQIFEVTVQRLVDSQSEIKS